MKSRRSFTALLFMLTAFLLCFSGCVKNTEIDPEVMELPYWDGEDAKYVNVTANCKAYGRWNKDWQDWIEPQFYLDPEKEKMVKVEEGSYHTQTLKVPSDMTDLYVVPPEIALYEKKEEQLIPLEQTFPIHTDPFDVVNVYIPELTDWNPVRDPDTAESSVAVRAFLVSENDQYPDFLSLRYDGRTYPYKRMHWEGDSENSVKYMSYQFEMPDLYTAAMAVKYGALRYSKLRTIITAKDAVYECDDNMIKLHILDE